tara:strand:+ start:42 stop:188 length:147 start_codon:yes stop_codon:yes gene_type:complete
MNDQKVLGVALGAVTTMTNKADLEFIRAFAQNRIETLELKEKAMEDIE